MHPIEYLRLLAQDGRIAPEDLLPEVAEALAALGDDRAEMVMACRMLIEHLPLCGPLWWICARLLLATDGTRALKRLVDEFANDPTPLQVSMALADAPDTEPLILECSMIASSGAVVSEFGSFHSEPMVEFEAERPVWVITGIGRVVPDRIFDAATRLATRHVRNTDVGDALTRIVPVEQIERIVGPRGSATVAHTIADPDVPVVPELLPR